MDRALIKSSAGPHSWALQQGQRSFCTLEDN